jgi:ribosomal protein S18 acetylase RimI-like enzyme
LIRPAVLSDEPAVRDCAERAYVQYVEAMGRRPAPMVADFRAQIRDGLVRVATDADGRVVGFVVYYPRGGAMHLENVAVLPEQAGQGIGKALIDDCEAAARRAGLPAVELYTNLKMIANLSIYPHLGYREIGRWREAGFDRVFFRKEFEGG